MAVQPTVDGARCVHAHIETASCMACVSACPKGAWSLDDEGLNLSESACDGCGLCVPACPPRAITMPERGAGYCMVGGMEARMLACAQALPEQDGNGVIPCLHAVGVEDLLRHWCDGDRIWLVAHGDCPSCARGVGESMGQRIARINTLLQARGRHQILMKSISPDQWCRLRQMGRDDPDAARVGDARRAFLYRLVRRPVAALTAQSAVDESPLQHRAPGEYLPGHGPLPWTVRIDPMACVACHACVQVCPSPALSREGGLDDGPVWLASCYRFQHAQCTGCGLCMDVCEWDAIRLQPWSRPSQEILLLEGRTCRACGAHYQTPAARREEADTCWVCRTGRVRPRLFQVLDSPPEVQPGS